MTEIEKMQAICFWLIKQMQETNAKRMKIKQCGVKEKGKLIGDFEIIIKKV